MIQKPACLTKQLITSSYQSTVGDSFDKATTLLRFRGHLYILSFTHPRKVSMYSNKAGDPPV